MRFPFKYAFFAVFCSVLLVSCGGGNADEVPLDEITTKTDVVRFDRLQREAAHAFAADSAGPALPVFDKFLKAEKPFIVEMLGLRTDTVIPDTAIATFLKDGMSHPDFVALLDSVDRVFPASANLETQWVNPLKRLHFYFPEQEIPSLRTFVSGYSRTAENGLDNLLFTEHYLGIGLHYFMGAGFPFYPPDLPMYIRRRCTPNHILPTAFNEIGDRMIAPKNLSKMPVLMDEMVRHGIRLYFLDKILPDVQDSLKIYYSPQQMEWATKGEAQIYKLMIADLYSTDVTVHRNYVEESPFSANFSRESPPRLGQYIGWQIVRSYMKNHPEVTLAELMANTDYQKIFQESQYRPE